MRRARTPRSSAELEQLQLTSATPMKHPISSDRTSARRFRKPTARQLGSTRTAGRKLLLAGALLLLVQAAPGFVLNIFGPFWSTGNVTTARYFHTATLLQNGKILVAGGSTGSGSTPIATAELYDPATGTWSNTGSLAQARFHHTATLLSTGQVLVVGGTKGSAASDVLASAEIYDTATGVWFSGHVASLTTARFEHTATLLPNGNVLVFGGSGASSTLGSAERYDPATNKWTATSGFTARLDHTATLLGNGKVLFAGGYGASAQLSSADVYDPANSTVTSSDMLGITREGHTATVLPSGKVLVACGLNSGGDLGTAQLYDPTAGTWAATGSLTTPRRDHTMTLLPNGKVLVAGGSGSSGTLQSAELYDPAAGTWSGGGTLIAARGGHTATLLASGKVVLAAGINGGTGTLNSAEFYDALSGARSNTASPIARYAHTSTLLFTGEVLNAGGHFAGFGNTGYLGTAELYNPGSASWGLTGNLTALRGDHTATLLPDGKVLLAGGNDANGPLATSEIYNRSNSTFTATSGGLTYARAYHSATLLPNGRVLVVGGFGVNGHLNTAEIYDQATNKWTLTSSLTTARLGHRATLLSDGRVLISGGVNTAGYVANAELYNPSSGAWTPANSLVTPRSGHTATLLPNGKVLVAAGLNGSYLSSAELYDPSNGPNGAWSSTGSLVTARFNHTATLLGAGKVLVAGGYNNNTTALADAELYEPLTGSWKVAAPLGTARMDHTATPLQSGQVLIAAGRSDLGGAAISSAELYDAGLGFLPAWQPLITLLHFTPGNPLSLTGSRFKGISEASGGNTSNSSSNYPLVQIRNLDSGQSAYLFADSWSDTGYASAPVTNAPFGPALATVFTNGIPSSSVLLNVGNPPSALAYSQNPVTYAINQVITNNVPSNAGGAVISYGISTALPAGLSFDTATGIISGTPTVLSAAKTYTVTATNTGGSTTVDVSIAIAKGSQAITFATIGAKTYGDPAVLLNATSSSGLKVSFSVVSGPAHTILNLDDGTTSLQITGAGTVVVRALQSGDGNYDPAPSVDQSFSVAKAPTSTALSATPNPAHFGDNVTFKATITSPAGTAFGTVQFKDNGANLGPPQNLVGSDSDSSAFATFSTSSLDSTAHTITAEYSGDPNFSASIGTLSGGEAVKRTVLANISTRLRVETADNVLIGGFIVTGTQPKRVIVRAIGPSLPVDGHLDDPVLELHQPDGSVITNDNWADAANKQEIIDSTVAPSNPFESAILTTLPANNSAYTAVVRGVNGGTGVALVEVFDLDGSVDSKLANISTRGLVQTAENVMIGGFIVLNGSQKVIVRAIGPSLPVEGALQDPLLELHDGNGNITINDNWVDSPDKQAIIDSTVAPPNSAESAVLQILVPGNYTAVVRGVNGATGVALVEVFALN
jgi:N-acetylneuraminic acid mutarotase